MKKLFIVFSRIDVSLHFHGSDQFLDLCGRMRNKLYRGEVVKYSIRYQDIQLLEKAVNQRVYQNEVGEIKSTKTCSHDAYDECIYKGVDKVMRKTTKRKCTAPWIPTNENICTNLNDIMQTYKVWKSWVEFCLNECAIPCHFVVVNVDAKDNHETTDTKMKDYAVLTLYYPSSVIKNVEHLMYDLERVLGEVGGYVSLLLGYSVLGSALDLVTWINNKVESILSYT